MMVAYSFQSRFVEPIEQGLKTHTLRAPGKRRHARIGEALQLYTGMRTRQCRLIGTAVCDRLHGVLLNFGNSAGGTVAFFDVVETEPGRFRSAVSRAYLRPVADAEAFARSDGFADLRDMAAFWARTHGATAWNGFLIGWKGFKERGVR